MVAASGWPVAASGRRAGKQGVEGGEGALGQERNENGRERNPSFFKSIRGHFQNYEKKGGRPEKRWLESPYLKESWKT